eukprot:240295_1
MQRYEVIRKIGKGSFGTVDLIRRRKDGKKLVLKRMKIGSVSKKERDMCHNEVHLLERLNHPSIVRYEESFVDTRRSETYLCVVMTYCDGGDLTHFLKNQRGRKLREKHVLDLFVQIALAMHFVHKRNILHRDLKAQNIFVKNGQLKLGDFGISKVLTGSVAFAQTVIGTPYYMSPEVFKGKPYNFKSDIWSLGCVLYELMTFKHCFDANNLNALAQNVVRGKYIPITGHQYRNDLKMLCYSMLNQLASSRPTLGDILRNKLLSNRIRDFYISCYKKHQKGVISQSTFNNLKTQLHELGLHHILDNIDDIAKQQSIKKAKQKKLREEEQKIEKEKRIHKDMELALEKLKLERKWRVNQKKQRQTNYRKTPHFSRRQRSFSEQRNMADKRRKAAKNRKLQILKQQEQRRQQLAAKHRSKQDRAARRKSFEVRRKTPYSGYSSRNRSPRDNVNVKARMKHKSPKKAKEEEQVEQLNLWENAHAINTNRNPKNHRSSSANPTKRSSLTNEHNKQSVPPPKSSLALLQQKLKHHKECDVLEGLKKRRQLIQKRLNEISERHKQRQINRQKRAHDYGYYRANDRSKSEQPRVSNKEDNRMQYASPNKADLKPMNARSSASSLSPSPLKYAGASVISSNPSSMSVSPAPESEIHMNPRQRMEARKRARADLRAQQLKEANKIVYKNNKIIAQKNKQINTAQGMQRAVSMEVLDELINDDLSRIPHDGAQSEPPFMNEMARDIATIKEDETDDEEEEIIQEEIDELKQTLIEQTMQIDEIKETILKQRKEQLSESDEEDDVETLLTQQEKTVQTLRMQVIQPVIENEMELDEESDESSEEMPIGRLVDRIEFIKRKCVEGMGLDGFRIAYNLMKQLQAQNNVQIIEIVDNKIKNLCINPNVSKYRVKKYRALIDQLLFIEANCS